MDDKQTNEPKELSLDHVFVIDNNLMPLVFMLIDEVRALRARIKQLEDVEDEGFTVIKPIKK